MATPIKQVEKNFLLKVFYDEQLPVTYLRNREKHLLFLVKPVKDEMNFRTHRPVNALKENDEIDLLVNYRGLAIVFSVSVLRITDNNITCTVPDFLYRNLDRSYSRVRTPQEMDIHFSFMGEHYSLSFPKVEGYEAEQFGEFFEMIDPKDLSGLTKQMGEWIKSNVNDYRLVLFKSIKPASTEECIVADTGLTLFLPSTRGDFPETDPFPVKRIITKKIFKKYLESIDVSQSLLEAVCTRFIREKASEGILSVAWVPILFHEYVIGYVQIWNDSLNRNPIDHKIIATLYEFIQVLTYSLKIHGYFEEGNMKNEVFDGRVINISASGLLFAYPHSDLSKALMTENNLTVKINTPERSISAPATIMRRFKDDTLNYFGCRFENMAREDFNFLFELIYGKPYIEYNETVLTGQV